MTATLPLTAPKIAKVHCHHRADVWLNVWPGVTVRGVKMVRAKNPERRARCERDFIAFKETYFPHMYQDPNAYHIESALAKQAAVLTKDVVRIYKGEAAFRGIGKTTDCRVLAPWCLCYGHLSMMAFITANSSKAKDHITSIKYELQFNEALAEDFPELCLWVRSFGGDARKCKMIYPHCEWSDTVLGFPHNAWIFSASVEEALPGMNKNGRRPELIIFDDIETLPATKSVAMQETLEMRVMQEALHLPDINKRAIFWYICTIHAPRCLTQRLTDPTISPMWCGRRYGAVIKFPDRKDLWDIFEGLIRIEDETIKTFATPADTAVALGLSLEGFQKISPGEQRALAYYVANREIMDAGAEVLDAKRMPLWKCMLARALDENSFQCEIQNDPPADDESKSMQLDQDLILQRRIGEREGVVPAWASIVTIALDMGKYQCYWTAFAWDSEGKTSCVIAQGVIETDLNREGRYRQTDDVAKRQIQVAEAVNLALTRFELIVAAGFARSSGEIVKPRLVGADVGGTAEAQAWDGIVLRFCVARTGWVPLKGATWRDSTLTRALGRSWICETENNPFRRHDCNNDVYKTRLYDALTAPLRDSHGGLYPGACILHKDAPMELARQFTAEKHIEISLGEEVRSGKELRVGWNHITKIPNHWWDTGWMNCALADIWLYFHEYEKRARRAPNANQTPPKNGPVRRIY